MKMCGKGKIVLKITVKGKPQMDYLKTRKLTPIVFGS